MSILIVGITAQGIAFGQDATPTPTSTIPASETATIAPTSTIPPTETATIPPTSTLTETPIFTSSPTSTETLAAQPTETLIPTETGTVTETPIATGSITPTATLETSTPTFVPTLTPLPTTTALPTGLTRMFFFQGLAGTNVDIYGNGIQLGGNVETGRMLGRFILLDGTATSLVIYPAGNLGQPTLISTLAFDPGSTVLVVAFNGPSGTPTLAVYRLDTASAQSQMIAINASDAPTFDVVTSSGPASSVARGSSTQITLAPGTTANLAGATGGAAGQTSTNPKALASGVVYLQIAVGSVANGTYRVVTQAIDVNTLKLITP